MPTFGIINENVGESLERQRIADYYTSLLHVSGADLTNHEWGITTHLSPNDVYDGVGNMTGLALSALHDRVIINNYIYPEGYDDPDGDGPEPVPDPTEWLDAFFPIGVIMLTTNLNNPGNKIAGTKWCQIDPPAQFLVGIGTGTDQDDNVYHFAPHGDQPLNGDLAGEYRHRLTTNELPAHLHVTNTSTVVLPPQDGKPNVAGLNEEGTNVSFFYYFGPPVNQEGNTVNSVEGGAFLGQDEIQAFQSNTLYNGQRNYRDWLIVQRHYFQGDEPYLYTDKDFSGEWGCTLGSYSLAGWGPSVVGGPGWAGFLDTTPGTPGWRPDDIAFLDVDVEDQLLPPYIMDSPRPSPILWTLNGHAVRILETHSGWDQSRRASNRVHPGTFTPEQLIIARDYIISVLGVKDAAVALAGVQRLIDMDATVEQALETDEFSKDTRVVAQIPATGIIQSAETGRNGYHNNVPPNYGVFAWRRVELDHICGSTRPEIPPLWEGIITTDQISNRGTPFNLGNWAMSDDAMNEDGEVWNGISPAEITIAPGVYIYSDDPNDSKVPGMTIGDFRNGLTLINKGFIMGRGGNGGYKGDSVDGQDGGDAIEIIGSQGEIIINNSEGAIGGGGGGGGGNNISTASGGGGGAGGGTGGRSGSYGSASPGGAPGTPGVHGRARVGTVSRCSTQEARDDSQILNDGWGPCYGMFPGVGGEAGGSGGGTTFTAYNGNSRRGGQSSNSSGGGGGRVLSRGANGGGTGGFPGSPRSVIQLNDDGSIFTILPAYAGQYSSYISGYKCSGRGRGEFSKPWGNCGYRYTASSSRPYMRAYSRGGGDRCGGPAWIHGYFSPTGWNSEHNYLAYVCGGWADQPAANFGDDIPDPRGVGSGYWGGGGGGWGAKGGDSYSKVGNPLRRVGGNGGQGGYAIRLSGSMSFTFVDEGGVSRRGLVYGSDQ